MCVVLLEVVCIGCVRVTIGVCVCVLLLVCVCYYWCVCYYRIGVECTDRGLWVSQGEHVQSLLDDQQDRPGHQLPGECPAHVLASFVCVTCVFAFLLGRRKSHKTSFKQVSCPSLHR